MTGFLDNVLGGVFGAHLSAAVLVIAAVSLLMFGYFLLVKSSNSPFSNRRR